MSMHDLPLTALLLATASAAQTPADAIGRCAAIDDDRARLACYDAAAGRVTPPVAEAPAPQVPVAPQVVASPLGERWAIGAPASDTLLDIRPHKPTYILFARATDRSNRLPSSPTKEALPGELPIRDVEAKFQVSFKFKLADFKDNFGASLWAAYSQQSSWQVYNGDVSRPFRETNYEPELMLAWHPDTRFAGWQWRLFSVGFVHQSNGRAEPLSRSWNRLYAQFGIERGDLSIQLRPWLRIRENIATDDNPDLTRFMGHGDLLVAYNLGGHTLSALSRYNLNSGKGAVQAGWSFPLARRVRGHVQLFSGYGESLIDYNWKQTTFGAGVTIADWQ